MNRGDVADVVTALRNDPWSADLTLGAALLYNAQGDAKASSEFATRFVQVAPNSQIVRGMHK